MSWITQAELRRDTPQARHLAYQLLNASRSNSHHDLVWNLFADDPGAARDFLYREAGQGRFLIVSSREPNGSPDVWVTRTRPYTPALAAGERYGFSLRANPTVSLSRPGRARSHRADVMMEAKRKKGAPLTPEEREAVALDWLQARGDGLGVRFERDRCGVMRQDRSTLPRGISLAVVDYDGELTVEAPERLREALTAGVGRGKAFGMGLLLLHRLAG